MLRRTFVRAFAASLVLGGAPTAAQPTPGVVRVRIVTSEGAIVLALDARRDGAGLAVEVRDTGVGIPADKLPKIFEKFYQVDNSAQPRSAGSGLVMVRISGFDGYVLAGTKGLLGDGRSHGFSIPDRSI